ncbi:DMT family transporter [Cellulomonas cellasea]|uniref:Drug/metabolite transporter (DMT)-like permease n=1 Tax=Cellulomonas cellasea TaxID=43670 RepID=A0A7W4YCF8_9CELL|nr:DMT family transporter [Cellulomonas cellasea]MBB2924054.1 drug/metabolite transporter (DMT)-like permease [Cellulomonas cellasea]
MTSPHPATTPTAHTTAAPAPAASGGWLGSYALLAVMWGCSFAFIALALDALTPVQVAFWRIAVGAVTLLVLAAVTRTPLPRDRRTLGHLTVLALLVNAVPFTLFALGQQSVSSVLAGIINAATPLTTLLWVALFFRAERPGPARSSGLVLGFLGLLVVMGVWHGLGTGQLSGVLACVGAITCYGLGFPYTRKFLAGTPYPPVALAAGQIGIAAVVMTPVVLVSGVAPVGDVTTAVVVAVLALGVLSSGVAFILNFRVIARAGTTTASSVTYLTPVVAAAVGVLFLGDHVTWNQPVGAVVVLLGVAIAQGRLRRRSPGTGRRSPSLR